MSIEIRRVNPFALRDKIIDFFWQIKIWPYKTKDEYFRAWNWRYSSFSEGEPAVWVALDNSNVVGHIAVFFRHLLFNGQRLRAGVAANLRVHRPYRESPISVALVRAPQSLVRKGEIDLFTGYGNQAAHLMTIALGSHDLGPMQTLFKVVRWAPVLRRRFGPLALFFSATAPKQSIIGNIKRTTPPALLKVQALSHEEIQSADISHWDVDNGLTWHGSLTYFFRRFGISEFSDSRVLGIFDARTQNLEGVVAASGTNQLTITQCEINRSALSYVDAVDSVVRANTAIDTVSVPLLPNTRLAAVFTDAGYMRLPAAFSDPVIRNTSWSAYWRANHPLAAELSQTHRWNIWYGWSHH